MPDFLLYGANGYTGGLILRRALAAGLRPLVAGRNAEEIGRIAAEHGLEHRVFPLDERSALDDALGLVPAVLHAAGPFAHTAAPMAEACIRTGTHYLDITGEIEVFEAMAALGARAAASGVMLLPGAAFDVVPSDCLAAHVKRRLPGAVRLRLTVAPLGGGVSRGTATTMIESMGEGAAVRRDGRIVRVPLGSRTRTVQPGFGTGRAAVTLVRWGDVSTAYHSTGIPDVEVYMRVSALQRRLLPAIRSVAPLLRTRPAQRLLKAAVRAGSAGPDEARRADGASLLVAEAEDADGRRVVSRMRGPEAYTFSAMTAVEAVRKVLGGDAPTGFRTPSLAYGPDWPLDLEGVERQDG